ncbi:alpha,alpha-trehalose-phosphate synthase (UDP-forming) [Nocardioides mesophilus]|uniref:Glucosylglycerol-phosphate synthase n=1 Tax=Nocardioides mesophilus TaxID=433659 RepID=A0A7G9RF74_9ACTN|nr:trehalose-6-phosphate synthase [Nocardioides mesophilus]QNN54249.1 trehalose-6-phosphate synthase [Nocardioides mesophilus]
MSGTQPRSEEPGLVVLSNRLPVSRVGNKWQTSAGGLVTALLPLVSTRPTSWVGWDGGSHKLPEKLPGTDAGLVGVGLSRADVKAYYDGFSNATLWPLFHDLVGTPEFQRSWWEAYQRVNRSFAEAALKTGEELSSPTYWVQDYQLMLVPQLLRAGTDAPVRYFLHIPFPAPELFARLPWRDQLLRGLLGADTVSFHTEHYRRNFVRACALLLTDVTVRGRDIVLEDGRVVHTQANPISIDTTDFAEDARSEEVTGRLQRLRRQFAGRRVLLGVDRLDYTKGIPERLLAFERLLEDREDLHGRVCLVQIAVPSRGDVEEYQRLRDLVDQLVGRINGRFTRPGEDVPVHYFHRGVAREDLLAYYLLADLMLVTPLKDGMNLVAKEFVTVQHAALSARSATEGAGALVLSEFTGAADEMPQAYLCNPFDLDGVSAVMATALSAAPEERRRRLDLLARRVRRHDIHAWAERELDQ